MAEIPLRLNASPVAVPPRKTPIAYEELVEHKLNDLLKRGIIEKPESFSPWQSALVPVPKGNGDIRLCVDLREVNKAVLRQPLPFPTWEELSVKFFGARYFSKIDIQDAFHQITLDPKSREITTFVTHKGTFRYTRLPFGIANAPELFQRVMLYISEGLQGVIFVIDDGIIYGTDLGEHDKRLKDLLERLAVYGVRLNTQKCEFRQSSIMFLGHQLCEEGILPDPKKIEALRRCKRPTTKEALQSFLGLLLYLGNRFNLVLARLTDSLPKLIRKGAHFV